MQLSSQSVLNVSAYCCPWVDLSWGGWCSHTPPFTAAATCSLTWEAQEQLLSCFSWCREQLHRVPGLAGDSGSQGWVFSSCACSLPLPWHDICQPGAGAGRGNPPQSVLLSFAAAVMDGSPVLLLPCSSYGLQGTAAWGVKLSWEQLQQHAGSSS